MRDDRLVELWVVNAKEKASGIELIEVARDRAGLVSASWDWDGGYGFRLLLKGSDY